MTVESEPRLESRKCEIVGFVAALPDPEVLESAVNSFAAHPLRLTPNVRDISPVDVMWLPATDALRCDERVRTGIRDDLTQIGAAFRLRFTLYPPLEESKHSAEFRQAVMNANEFGAFQSVFAEFLLLCEVACAGVLIPTSAFALPFSGDGFRLEGAGTEAYKISEGIRALLNEWNPGPEEREYYAAYFQTLPPHQVYRWMRDLPGFAYGLGRDPAGRALACLAQLHEFAYSGDELAAVVRCLIGFEALTNPRQGSTAADVVSGLERLLGGQSRRIKEWIHSLYSMRNHLLHASMDLPYPATFRPHADNDLAKKLTDKVEAKILQPYETALEVAPFLLTLAIRAHARRALS